MKLLRSDRKPIPVDASTVAASRAADRAETAFRAAYGRAALEYRASLSFLESKVRTLLTAITGQ